MNSGWQRRNRKYLCTPTYATQGIRLTFKNYKSTIAAEFPNLDTLINNAGIMRNLDLNRPHELTDVTLELAVNLCGPVQMVQAFLPALKTRPDALIVNVSSGLAFVPFPLSPMYSAAKAGVHAYTRCLRAQLARTNVRVVELAPPGTETPLFRGEFEKEMKGPERYECAGSCYEGDLRY